MSVEEDNRQEWTFTLYDFDNNGKVTRQVLIFTVSLYIRHVAGKVWLIESTLRGLHLPAMDLRERPCLF